jgi:putative transposase
VLNPIRDDLLAAMKVAQEKNGNFKIEIDEVDHDHIHLLVRIKPNESISRIVHDLKQQSTYLMWQNHHDYLSKFYWSGQHHLWTRGYFASTIGGVSEKTLVEYIKNQG